MFAGKIPGLTKEDAKEWAKDTDFKKLPERAPNEKGKPTLRSKKAEANTLRYLDDKELARTRRGAKVANGDMLQYFLDHPDKAKAHFDRKKKAGSPNDRMHDARNRELQRRAAKCAAALPVELLVEAFKIATLGSAAANPRNVGKLRGMMTTNSLKAPGFAASTQAVNPRRSLINAMNFGKPH